jgi:hypothetical protein
MRLRIFEIALPGVAGADKLFNENTEWRWSSPKPLRLEWPG